MINTTCLLLITNKKYKGEFNMNNFRKIGLTALAGSLVASAAVAGDLAVTGAAEMAVKNHSHDSNGKSVSMVNSVNFAGSGETDGGLTVGSTETVDTYLGYDASQLLTNYDVAQNISPYAAINLFDLELWKLFYDAQNYNVRIESFIHNEYTSGGQLEPFQTIDIPSPPLNPIINGDGYQTYRTDETRFATLEGSGDYTPIQWPFEDLPVNGLNPNGPSFSGLSPFNETVHPSLAVFD